MPKAKRIAKRKPVRTKTAAKPAPTAAIVRVNPAPVRPWSLNSEEVTLIKNNVAKGASDEELKFLLTVARRYRLDPFKQQIWFVKRWDKNADDGRGGKGAHVWTPQVGINGLLYAAARDHKKDLGSIGRPQFGPMVLIPGHGKLKAPEWASVKIYKKGATEPTEAEAWWDEYAPADLSKAPFWARMPRRMLAKCATALAIRQAYPDLGGLYIPEEMERMNEDVTPGGRQIVEANAPKELPTREVTEADLQRFESITVTPWKEGRVALSGDSGLAIIKVEFSPETIADLGILHNAKERVTHMPTANVFKLIDRAAKCNVEVHYADSPGAGLGDSAGGAAPQGEAPPPVQGKLL